MNSIPQALTWEFYRRYRWQLLLAWAGAVFLPLMILSSLAFQGLHDLPEAEFATFFLSWLIIQAFGYSTALIAPQGDSLSRLYSWPVTTETIVRWRLFHGMSAAALLYILNASLLNALFNIGWPLLAPALFLACAYPAFQAALWLGERAPLLQIVGMTAVAVPLGLWAQAHCGGLFARPTHYWKELTGGDLVLLAGLALAGYAGCLMGVARDRCSQTLWWLGVSQWFESWWLRRPAAQRPLRSPLVAQFWYEWRQKGLLLPVATVLAVVIFAIVTLVRRTPVHDAREVLGVAACLLPVLGIVVGLALGSSGCGRDRSVMSAFPATRPLTSTAVACTILGVTGASVLTTWLILAAILVLLGLATDGTAFPLSGDGGITLWFIAALPLTWVTTALAACAIAAGHSKLIVQINGAILLSAIGWVFLIRGLLHLSEKFVVVPFLTLFVAAIVVGTIWAYAAAWRQRLIAPPLWWVLSPLAAILLPASGQMASEGQGGVALAIVCGALACALPFAAGPLAIAWNRHR